MSKTPYMPLWVADFLGDTLDLESDEIGSYMLLLMTQWRRNGESIPENKLKRVCRCGRNWKRVWDNISHYFDTDDDGFYSLKLRLMYADVNAKREVNKHNGARGGQAKSLKNKKQGLANAKNSLERNGLQKSSISEPEPYNDTITSNSIISKDELEDTPPDGENLIDKYFDTFLSAVGKDNSNCPSDMQIFSVPVSWIVNGCNPELDITPVLKAVTAKNPNIRSWNYFTNAVYEAKARREAKPPDIHINQVFSPQKPSKTDKLFDAINDVDDVIKSRLTA